MKIKYELTAVEVGDDIVNVPVGEAADDFHAVLSTNEEASFLLNLLKEDTTEEEVVKAVIAEYDGTDAETIREYVHNFIETVRGYGLLEE